MGVKDSFEAKVTFLHVVDLNMVPGTIYSPKRTARCGLTPPTQTTAPKERTRFK